MIQRKEIVMLEVTTDWYLTLAAILFTIGFLGMMIRKNALIMFMCIELMLNAVNLTFISASNHFGKIDVRSGRKIGSRKINSNLTS